MPKKGGPSASAKCFYKSLTLCLPKIKHKGTHNNRIFKRKTAQSVLALIMSPEHGLMAIIIEFPLNKVDMAAASPDPERHNALKSPGTARDISKSATIHIFNGIRIERTARHHRAIERSYSLQTSPVQQSPIKAPPNRGPKLNNRQR